MTWERFQRFLWTHEFWEFLVIHDVVPACRAYVEQWRCGEIVHGRPRYPHGQEDLWIVLEQFLEHAKLEEPFSDYQDRLEERS
jgi:hypothetical protein